MSTGLTGGVKRVELALKRGAKMTFSVYLTFFFFKLVKSDTRGTREAQTNKHTNKQTNKQTKPIKTVVP
jgi:hypothetical protein